MTPSTLCTLILCLFCTYATAQDPGNGTYRNPVINADYSDPDVCAAGSDFYMTASSFNCIPGLPILHSTDLVNWSLIGHALHRLPPYDHFSRVQHGGGVWAPAIRYHNKEFYIYYPDPDFGIYMIKAKSPKGPWSDPVLVKEGRGIIDPCPFWDEDGQVYLIHAYAGSRAGIKSVLTLHHMNAAGTTVTDAGILVVDGHPSNPTLEGPKLYKRNGYYYIFAPAGGVSTGWQLVLRAKKIEGPYEEKIVMDQGNTPINGPHQGAWVTTTTGTDWFLHFQDKDAYGRVVHLQPMKWVNNWPVIGIDKDGDGKGEPVLTYKKPFIGNSVKTPLTGNTVKTLPTTGNSVKTPLAGNTFMTPPTTGNTFNTPPTGNVFSTPLTSDEFNTSTLGLQWQWQANPLPTWGMLSPAKGVLRLFSAKLPDSLHNYWDVPNLLLQKFPNDTFTVTTVCKFTPNPNLEGERTGLIIMGADYASLSILKKEKELQLLYSTCKNADKGKAESQQLITTLKDSTCYFRVKITEGAICQFSYSNDGNDFIPIKETFTAKPGRWIGAKVGLFCIRPGQINDAGYADYDWFRVE
ncbi:glycoside hydrolase 43 family protein [[Flexibacter] sp. ATCC 35208]|uniref:glycoside hydrolase family 43 protein n=1 Tax=[Flexibacter] sp. ATCC 35208 TaxID=1936242 RepID=UPI001F196083|nr:glycoside hydrolase 43 family protein [[Flexibacter] sp. ATCC 35208]